MKKIQMVDLQSQYQLIKSEVDQAITSVIESAAFINGPAVKTFQTNLESYLGVKHVINCANGTDALQIAFMALGLQPGDEVIVPTFTYVATAEVIALLRLEPVLVDVDPVTFCVDPAAIEANITSKTKAIVPVHLFGQCANMDAIMEIANRHNLYVIEDTAQAIGAKYTFNDGSVKRAGCIGHIGTTSFFPSKNLGCYGDGGAIMTNDDKLAETLRMVANHGQRVRYYHDEVGVNSRLDTVQAAILDIKLKHLDRYEASRNEVAAAYDQAFGNHPKLTIPARNSKSTHVFHQYTLLLADGIDREAVRAKMEESGVPTMIYYPVPLHEQKAYQSPRYPSGSFPVSEMLCKRVLSLPIHTEMEKEQLDHIITSFLNTINSL